MNMSFENHLSIEECKYLLGEEFTPDELYSRVDITQYAQKISEKAFFLLDKDGNKTRGFIAYYLNNESSFIFITRIAVSSNFRHQGIGRKMIDTLSNHYSREYKAIELEVEKTNDVAMKFYHSMGFDVIDDRETKFLMCRELNSSI